MLINLIKLKKNSLASLLGGGVLDLPTPSFISYLWNWGFILGIVLIIQILTGLILASHYNSYLENAFYSVIHTIRDVNIGYFIRYTHINGASLFFIVIYTHIFRNIIFSSFKNKYTWLSGIIILFLLIGTAFIGYVLPWGQMSYWGATVITNLASAIPMVGQNIVLWLWGGFSIGQGTLTRFFILHFLIPFILSAIVVVHIFFLHEKGSSNPLGITIRVDKIPFLKFFAIKDFFTLLLILVFFIRLVLLSPFILGDPENFIPANPLNTPIHIMPEWYFLFAYAILRRIPNKLGGVLALVMAILIFLIHVNFKKNFKTLKFKPFSKIIVFIFMFLFICLTWLGSCVVESPFEQISQVVRGFYFRVAILL